ncbi:hypothetical protein KM176_17040 [Pseudooceanicola sp. CBS1P-1]|uniref:DUF1127 domain-containing protein n=1 Tax=Pseudooceanicola albus TaxID=2692189 RepID=A0A6L7G685_9RHOB|nr:MULTISPECIES: hypothetical protein [Pseudooceanicola]MBT9385580.1 hypothetical protein [Pseudooceanicola endophyticus]MXN19008.1 hypothetical protein [Pseudooceanicola albus]
MASFSSNVTAPRQSALGSFFAAVGAGLAAYMERRSRSEQIAKLQAKSDVELSKMGLKREEIPAYVFRDLFYV